MNIEKIITHCLSGLGYECVDVEFTPQGVLRVFMDHPNGITIDSCVYVHNHLNRTLAVENIDYKTLEVSSPGLDRPLKKEQDFVKYVGSIAKIKTRLPVDEQKKFIGKIIEIQDKTLTLFCETMNKLVKIELDNIEQARLKPQI